MPLLFASLSRFHVASCAGLAELPHQETYYQHAHTLSPSLTRLHREVRSPTGLYINRMLRVFVARVVAQQPYIRSGTRGFSLSRPAAMDKPCCVGVVRSADALTGAQLTHNNTTLYYSAPKVASKVNKHENTLIVASTNLSVQIGVVVVTDIFGFKIPNGKYIGKKL